MDIHKLKAKIKEHDELKAFLIKGRDKRRSRFLTFHDTDGLNCQLSNDQTNIVWDVIDARLTKEIENLLEVIEQ